MRVASWSAVMAAIRSLTASGCLARYSRPRASRSARESTQPSGSPSAATASAASRTTTCASSGRSARRSRALASCAASSAIRIRLSESERMNADSSAFVLG